MIRRLSRYLLASASLLAAAVAALPAGCALIHGNNCTNDDNPCADDHTEQICLIGEGDRHLSARTCPLELRCEDDETGVGHCVAAREGEHCVSVDGCFDSPLCVDGKCSAVPPAVVSACDAAAVLTVPMPEDGPDGVTLVTTFEPGKLVVGADLEIDLATPGPDGIACVAAPLGPERVIKLGLPPTWSPEHPGEIDLVVTIEGIDRKAVPAVTMITLEKCGEPLTYVTNECGHSLDVTPLSFTVAVASTDPQTWTMVLQASEVLTASVPFTIRAQLVHYPAM